MGGAVNRDTFKLVRFLFQNQLVDRIESRYIIFDLDQNLIDNFNKALKLANEFELEAIDAACEVDEKGDIVMPTFGRADAEELAKRLRAAEKAGIEV